MSIVRRKSFMNIKTLIFDFDGTIADTFEAMVEISNFLAKEFNFKHIADEELTDYKNKTSQEMLKVLNIPTLKIPRIAQRARSELNKKILSVEPISGLEEILQQLKTFGYTMGILSSNSLENVLKFLQKHHLDVFDFVQTSSLFWSKNHGLKKLIAKEGLNAQEILYIGDETRDIEAARKSGIQVAAVTWGYNSSKTLKSFQPDYLIHTPLQLLELCAISQSKIKAGSV